MKLTKKQHSLADAIQNNMTKAEILTAIEQILAGLDKLDQEQGKTPPATRGFEEGGDLVVALMAVTERWTNE